MIPDQICPDSEKRLRENFFWNSESERGNKGEERSQDRLRLRDLACRGDLW